MGEFSDRMLDHMFDPRFEEYYDGWAEPQYSTCRRCNTRMLSWSNAQGRWTLVDQQGKRHRCPVDRSRIRGFLATA